MEGEVSGIAKLGIVLIALAVLIGLGFGIFQISKGTANTGVNNVQSELDSVSQSQFTTYDQTTITGTMARSAITDFEGENTAVLIATQAWVNIQENAQGDTDDYAKPGSEPTLYKKGAGFGEAYIGLKEGEAVPDTVKTDGKDYNSIPVVFSVTIDDDGKPNGSGKMVASNGKACNACFINYNAILGNKEEGAAGTMPDTDECKAGFTSSAIEVNMGYVYFDSNCYRCTSGFAVDNAGKVVFNNITGNLSKTGRTEFLPTGAKFQSYLVKDASGTPMGIALQQSSGN